MKILAGVIAFGIALILFAAISSNGQATDPRFTITYSDFLNKVVTQQVDKVFIDGHTIYGMGVDKQPFRTDAPEDPGLMADLVNNNVEISAAPIEKQSFLSSVFVSWLPFIVLIGVWVYFMRRNQSGGAGGGGAFKFGKAKAKTFEAGQVKIKFADVAGVEEAKEEVTEVVDFLRDATHFTRVGGRIPRGILMVGSPGTGKTLLAKAIAGEAEVPFFSISGSDFVEMFVGVGASRVRDLFIEAKKQAPCIVFIDEIDAVGRKRGSGMGGGNDEREQTLNQLLVEMDGFEGNEGIVVIAATNRPDVLDNALLRPGRFDRQVTVPLPDIRGREQILKVHMRKIPAAEEINPAIIARGTPGFSGADLANLVNEAALFAARERRAVVIVEDFEKAKDKIMMGAERKSMVMSDQEKELTAYHEAGHAIVGLSVPEHDPVHKVSIIPRGRALGVTMYLPEQDRLSYSKRRLESQLSSLYGGRIAEEIIFGEDSVTTGASNDIQRATELATNMVKKWGLSAIVGPLAFTEEEGSGFLGQGHAEKAMSESTAEKIDMEIRKLIEDNYKRSKNILEEKIDILHAMAKALIEYETIDSNQVNQIMKGEKPTPPKDYNAPDDKPPSNPKTKDEKVSKSEDGENLSPVT
ncbi:MAG TPA: ATP-dependent metallopeptidase FtsH/Yme1/Tma family protein [Gammaproteobacteria bacterium]|nr:ATP-dependent metallopeptidase FtsH/Yme1/Tma family protein [Gammaproteobacteria bacterium]